MRTSKTDQIVSHAKEILSTHALAKCGYAFRADGTPCGTGCTKLHSIDLAGALWLAARKTAGTDDADALFGSTWAWLKYLCQRPSGEESPKFCKYLDAQNKEWHLALLTRALDPASKPQRRTAGQRDDSAKRLAIVNQYC